VVLLAAANAKNLSLSMLTPSLSTIKTPSSSRAEVDDEIDVADIEASRGRHRGGVHGGIGASLVAGSARS